MELLDKEQAVRQEIFNYFGYVEGWRVLPLDDARAYFWVLEDKVVRFAESPESLEDKGDGDYYKNEIYTNRHLPKWVYEGADYTMIVVDTHTDGNQLLQIFDNAKKVGA